MLFGIFKCSINLNFYVECYGHRVAMDFLAPHGIIRYPLFIYCEHRNKIVRVYWNVKKFLGL